MMRADPDPASLLAGLPRRLHHPVFARAATDPHRLALSDAQGAWSYADLAAATSAAAGWLGERGVRGGDRVLIITENTRQAGALLLACSALDAWAVLVNARLSGAEIADLVARSEPRLVCGVLNSVQARGHATALGLGTAEIPGLGKIAVGETNEAASAEPLHGDAARQVAALIYTSGSSGVPKGVMLTHRNLLYMAAVSGGIRALQPDDKLLGVLPVSHIVGLAVVFLGALMHGASVQFVQRFTPPAFLKALADDRVSVVLGAPAMLSLLLDYAAERGEARILAPHLRIVSVSGAPLEQRVKEAAEVYFGLPVHHGYGITECGPTIAQIRPGAERPDCSVGPLLPGVEARFEGPEGEAGELFIRSPSVMLGYFRDAAQTAEVLDAQGWFRTGDLARLDDGHLTVVGRAKDIIIRYGFNVTPAEVEAVLCRHPSVLQAAVAGRKSEAGEDILAFVVPRAGHRPDAGELAQHAAQALASYKRPTRIFVVPALPTTPTGKIAKRALVEAL